MLKKAKTLALCALVILTLAMSVRDQLPATQDEIVRALASVEDLPAAAAALRRDLVLDPHPTKGGLRRMRAGALAETTPTTDSTISNEAIDRLAILVGLTSCLLLLALRTLVRRLRTARNIDAPQELQ